MMLLRVCALSSLPCEAVLATRLTSLAIAEEFRVLHGSYADTQPERYNQTQPRDKRKKGFLSGDARKRDMAMNTTMGVIMGETFAKVCAMARGLCGDVLARRSC